MWSDQGQMQGMGGGGVNKLPLEWRRVPLQASNTISSTNSRKNGRNSASIDDLEEKWNTEVTDSEEETDDEGSSKGASATQSTSQP